MKSMEEFIKLLTPPGWYEKYSDNYVKRKGHTMNEYEDHLSPIQQQARNRILNHLKEELQMLSRLNEDSIAYRSVLHNSIMLLLHKEEEKQQH